MCVNVVLPDDYIMNGDMWVHACCECIVAKSPSMTEVLFEWHGRSDA